MQMQPLLPSLMDSQNMMAAQELSLAKDLNA